MACSSISGDMTADAAAKAVLARVRPSSTFRRRVRFSRTTSMNCFISSSRLSLRSLWPRLAVRSRPLSRVSSMRVGFTFKAGMV